MKTKLQPVRKATACLFISLALQISVQAQPTKTATPSKEDGMYRVTGVLLKKDKSPASGYTVYLLHRDRGIVEWECDEAQKLMNPTANSDASGRFTLLAQRSFIQNVPKHDMFASDYPEEKDLHGFTILLETQKSPAKHKVLVYKEGKPLLFKIDHSSPSIDLREINVDLAVEPAAEAMKIIKSGGQAESGGK